MTITDDKNKPGQYIQGFTEFYKLKFKVTPDVLIPRPETELLVDQVLNFFSHYLTTLTKKPPLILDIGTGSGCIAISIAKNYPSCHVIATDISTKALKVAQQNAQFHQVKNQITFLESNLLSIFLNYQSGPVSHVDPSRPLPKVLNHVQTNKADLIVTNLPYIPTYRIPYLDSSVKDFEPHIALDGGTDGFDLYRKLFQQITDSKLSFKMFIGEIDYTQGEIARMAAQAYFPQAKIRVNNDLSHKQRILTIDQTPS